MAPVSESNPDPETVVYSISAPTAQSSDSGQWRCEVTNNYGRSAAEFAVKVLAKKHIEVPEPPTFTSTFDNQLVDDEDNVTFKCEVTGSPYPDIRWFRDSIPIDEKRPGMEQFKVFERDGYQNLRIKRARVQDSAVYKCKISNVAGWASWEAKLYVKEGKGMELFSYSKSHSYNLADKIKSRRANEGKRNEADTLVRFQDSDTITKFLMKWSIDESKTLGFAEHLKSKCSVEGSFASLTCLARGIQPLKVRWYKNHKEIFEGRKFFIKDKGGILSLEIPCTHESDTGNYMCEVRNSQGKIYSSCYLQVEPVLEITDEVPTKPEFIKPMKRMTVDEGELIRFRVTVKGYPAPGFKWYKDGLEIHDSDRITTEMMRNGVAQLVIERAITRDIGLYTCEAHNLAGRAKSMVRISVRDKFEMELMKTQGLNGADVKTAGQYDTPQNALTNGGGVPKIDFIPSKHGEEFQIKPVFTHVLPHSLTVTNKARLMLECCCNAIPRPKVTWFKDGNCIARGPRYNFLSLGDWFGLEIPEGDITDCGKYSIRVKNERGEVTSSCNVEMKLPTANARNVNMPIETALDVSKRSDRHVAMQTEEQVLFNYAMIVPSPHLCKTELDWTSFIQKEVEVVEAEESPSFPDVLPDKVTPPADAENVTISCKVQGNPIPRVVWFKDGKIIDAESEDWATSFDMEARESVLTIKKLTEAETGKYTCVAYSENGGHATTSTEVAFRAPPGETESSSADAVAEKKKSLPEFKVKLEDTSASVGSRLKLEVVTEGTPAPEIQWFKSEEEIKPNLEKYSFENSQEGGHALVISGVHVADADCYKCVAVNECGMVSTCAHVCVKEQCVVMESGGEKERPTFSEPLHSTVSRQGEAVVFKCVANGSPAPTFTWLKDDISVESGDRVVISSNDGCTSLTIKEASISDAGLYMCVAENEAGKVESCSSLQIIADDNSEAQQAEAAKTAAAPEGSTEDVQAGAGDGADCCGAHTADAAVKDNVPNFDIKDFDFLKRPKFIARPLTQWVVADDELYLSVEVAKAENTAVNWYHYGKLVEKGRFKFVKKDTS